MHEHAHDHEHQHKTLKGKPRGRKSALGDFAQLTKGPLVRFGVSLPGGLLGEFDGLIERRGYGNRSEALRDLIRDSLIQDAWDSGRGTQLATLTLVYDHSSRGLQHRMTELQHRSKARILSSLHVHVSHEICLEILVLQGPGEVIRREADRLIAMRGVLNGKLVVAGGVE